MLMKNSTNDHSMSVFRKPGRKPYGLPSPTSPSYTLNSQGGRGNFTYLLEGQINFALKLSVGCLKPSFHMVVNVSRLCRKCRRDRL